MVTAEIENADLIEELLAKGGAAPEPGDFMGEGRIIHGGDEDAPVPILASSVTSAGYVTVYDTQTREPSVVNQDLLGFQLRKLRADGTRAFTRIKPKSAPVRGTLKCMLHPDNPQRREYDGIGFKTCPKANLMTPFDVENHMKARHKKEWATLEAERMRTEKAEERAFQKQMMAALATAATAQNQTGITKQPATKQLRTKKPKQTKAT